MPVERLQPLDRDVLDVGSRPDDRASVVVPEIGARGDALAQHVERAVLPRLELVAHNGHLRVEIAPSDRGVHHAVGLDLQNVVERLPARRESLEVIGPVVRGAAVEARSALLEVRLDVRKAPRPAEHQVLEEMRHSGLAVAFVARADEVGDVDGDRIDRAVGDEQDLQSVREAVLGDAFDRGDPRNAFRQRPLGRPGSLRRSGERREEKQRGEKKRFMEHERVPC